MSPEQAIGRNDRVDARSDIYSVGALAYALLVGRPPFLRSSVRHLLHAHAFEPVVPPSHLRPEVPADLEAIVLRCLEKSPAHRFQDVGSLASALVRCACAGQWTEEMATAWWREHTRPVTPHDLPAQETRVVSTGG